jgi:hypothetical protein
MVSPGYTSHNSTRNGSGLESWPPVVDVAGSSSLLLRVTSDGEKLYRLPAVEARR